MSPLMSRALMPWRPAAGTLYGEYRTSGELFPPSGVPQDPRLPLGLQNRHGGGFDGHARVAFRGAPLGIRPRSRAGAICPAPHETETRRLEGAPT